MSRRVFFQNTLENLTDPKRLNGTECHFVLTYIYILYAILTFFISALVVLEVKTAGGWLH